MKPTYYRSQLRRSCELQRPQLSPAEISNSWKQPRIKLRSHDLHACAKFKWGNPTRCACVTLLFRTSEERTLRLHASLPATRWPRHACTRRERVSAERVVQAFFVPYKNAGLQFQLSLWSCVRFSVCLGMILATWLKETFVYRAVKDVLAFEFVLGRNRECFVRTDIWHPPWASPRFACRAGLLCCLWKHGSTVPLVSWSCVRFEVCLGMVFATWLKETFVYHAVQDVLAFELFLGRNRECLVRTDIVVSESALRVSCRPYLLSVKTWVYCSSCLVVVCSFQDLSGNDIHYISEGDFHLSCCARSFISYRFSWEKSWMFCENCACHRVLRVSYCVVQSCRVCVACSSCTVIFFVFFFMIMIREYRACFILHSAWRWAHVSKMPLN